MQDYSEKTSEITLIKTSAALPYYLRGNPTSGNKLNHALRNISSFLGLKKHTIQGMSNLLKIYTRKPGTF